MTPQEYNSAGYKLSLQESQPEIDRAEREVMAAYVLPILPNATTDDCAVREAVMALAFLYILQHSIFATRGGASLKSGVSSTRPSQEAMLTQMAFDCDRFVSRLRQANGANATAKVQDVCRIYFSTNFFYI